MQDQTKVVRIVIDASKARDGSAEVEKSLKGIDSRIASLGRSIDSTFDRLGGVMTRFFGAYLGTQGVNAIRQAADAYTQFTNALRVAGVQGQAFGVVQDRLFTAANKNGVEIGALAQLYSRVSLVSRELGASQSQMLQFVDGVTAALRVQGGSTEQASGALLQLSQSLGSGIIRAEEFNSILEGALPIAQAAARGMDGMGGSVAKLRAAVVAGKVTSQEFFDALLKGFGETEKQAADMSLTIGGALTGLENSWVKFVGTLDETTGASSGVVSAIGSIANALEHLSDLARAARSDMSLLLSIAANPVGAIAGAFLSKTPVEEIASKIDAQRKAIDAAQQGLNRLGPNDLRRRYAEEDLRGAQATLAALQRQQAVITVGGKVISSPDDPDNIGISIPRSPTVVPPPSSKSGGGSAANDNAADRYEKLIESLRATASAQDDLTAAMRGDAAYDAQQIHLDAVEKSVTIFGHALDDTDPKLQAIEDKLRTIAEGKAAQAFIQGTNALRDQNEVLEAQIGTMNEAPGVQAKMLAGIKARQEAEKGGKALDDDSLAARQQAIEQNETLKAQQEQLRQAQELWTEPLKRALQDIQSTAADAFEKILDSGNLSFQSLAETFGKVIKRMAAEFLALATVRPVMSVLVQGLGGVGLVSPSMASQLGFPVSGASTSGGSSSSFGSGGGILGRIFGGGTGSTLGSFGDWLNTPFIGQSYGGAGSYDSISDLISSGSPGLTPLGAIGGAASIGMGAFQLAQGNTIGGAAGMLGGAMGLIGAVVPALGALGPIGMGVGLVGGLLGGLLGGGGTPPLPPLRRPSFGTSAVNFTPAGFTLNNGSQDGGPDIGAQGNAVGNAVLRLQRLAGLQGVTGKMYGGILLSGTHYNNLDPKTRQWIAENYTQSQLYTPGGGTENINYEDTTRNIQQQAEALIAGIFKANATRGGYADVSQSLQAGLTRINPTSESDIASVITLSKAYDRLGKASNPVKDAIDKISDSFGDLTDFANRAGLSLEPVNDEIAKQTRRTAQDFIDNMIDPLAVQLRALDDQRQQALTAAQYIKDNITGVYVDMAKVAEYYTRKEADLRESFYASQIQSLQGLIQRLTYGDLANASPAATLTGTRGSYRATLAQAQGGDQKAIDNLSQYAEAYVSAARGYFASSPEYQAIVDEVRAALANQVGVLQAGGPSASPAAANDAAAAVIQSNAVLSQTVTAQQQQIADLTAELSNLSAQLKRIAVNL